ncbi:MAG: DUF6493 family protein [Flavobacteriales bacterium]
MINTLIKLYENRDLLGLEQFLTDKSEEKRKAVGEFLDQTEDLSIEIDPEIKRYVPHYDTTEDYRIKEAERRRIACEKHFCYQILCAYYYSFQDYQKKYPKYATRYHPFVHVPSVYNDIITRILFFQDKKEYFTAFYKVNVREKPQAFIADIHKRNASPESFATRIRWETMRVFYTYGLMPYDKMTFLGCLLHPFWGKLNSYEPDWKEGLDDTILKCFLPTDELALEVLYGIFEMEITISGVLWQQGYSLESVFLRMVQKGQLDRAIIQEKLIQAMGNPTFKKSSFSWFTNMYKNIKFSNEENLKELHNLMGLLTSDVGGIRKLALDVCKKQHKNKAFDWQMFESQIASFVNFEGKGNLKTFIKIIEFRLSQNPKSKSRILEDLAGIYINQDADIQKLATAIFLSETLSENIKSALEIYKDNMITEVQQQLFGDYEKALAPLEKYACTKNYIPKLPAALDISTTEEDYIYLLSQTIKSENKEDKNKILARFADFQYLSTEKPELLKPIKRQVDNKIKRFAYTDFDIFLHYWIYSKEKFSSIWSSWIPLTKRLKKVKKFTQLRYYDFKPESIQGELKKKGLPLLSDQSKSLNYQILFNRLKEYFAKEEKPNLDDFMTAYNSVSWSDRDTGVKEIKQEIGTFLDVDCFLFLAYRIGFQTKWHDYERYIEVIFKGSFYHSIIENLGKAPILSIPTNEGLWIKPEVLVERLEVYQSQNSEPNIHDFSLAIQRLYLYNKLPNIDSELEYFQILDFLFTDKDIPKKRTEYWEKAWVFATQRKFPLQTSILYKYDKKQDWAVFSDFKLKVFYDGEFTRINTELAPNLHGWTIYPYTLTYEKPFFTENDFMQNINYTFSYDSNLYLLNKLMAKPQFLDYHGQLFLIEQLFNEKKESRHLALECFIQLIELKLLSKDIFNIITDIMTCHSKAVPVGRVLEFLTALKDMQGVYYDICIQIFEQLFAKLQLDQIPRSSAKLFQLYGEILKETDHEISEQAQNDLTRLQTVKSLKKAIAPLLKMSE